MENKMITPFSILRLAMMSFLLIGLSACQTDWQDPSEGSAVKAAIRAQSVYPDGRPDVPTYVSGRDGITARSSIEAYQRSFAIPAGGAAGGASAGGASAAPTTSSTPM
ncbi:hypothetical protein [Polynucleobacter sp. UB-Tiil-W10]|uniref:hypothetical protein n=1 Tax=Polynucleobacter sp. UB-Tiil-W10 TaxID=1855648 RepID=UPI001C0BEB20|nr:hypothetical protein [Polynucleobacter sp. UB-Tiil-W10]MBU3541636.1 hypothetical protein [Polynucleobacter sp. UB-Tiil-W10]